MAAAARLATIQRNLGNDYSGFEGLCINKDFDNAKAIIIAQNGMNNLSDLEIRLIMGEVVKGTLLCICLF